MTKISSFKVTPKQKLFMDSDCDEVFFGGAAGGGKSYGQLIDALLFALKYKGSRQLILRRTFPELERSLISLSLMLFPSYAAKFLKTKRLWQFKNGSVVEFGHCENETDVSKYQSAEYDVIRFDEVTHFTEFQYTYLLSRLRGVNGYPKQIKATGNPGGVGHAFIKKRFIDRGIYDKPFKSDGRRYIFIPAKVSDNKFLIQSDPDYLKRLSLLPDTERRRLLNGDWDAFEGRYYPEFSRDIHVVKPFPIPSYYRRFASLDYGLDMTACLFYAVDEQGRCYVYKEIYESGLNLSQAAEKIAKYANGQVEYVVASPDLWGRRQESGITGAEIMNRAGLLNLIKADDRRVSGWRTLREWITPYTDEFGRKSAKLLFFEGECPNTVRCLPLLEHDKNNNEDARGTPHEITHAPDSLRYGVMSRPSPASCDRVSVDIVKEIFGLPAQNEILGGEPTKEYLYG